MACLALPQLRETFDSEIKIGSDPETKDRTLDIESGTVYDLNKPAPGMWSFPTNPEHCCIYRVPNCIRRVNPEAYTPQLLILGPLHHPLKAQALKARGRGDISNTKSMGYLNMEAHKKIYLAEFARRVDGQKTIDGYKKMIEEEEERIRESYSESTAWIESPEFVEMILHDSVFIVEFMLRNSEKGTKKTRDPLVDEPCLRNTVEGDLILLENQLPYFILEKLFDPIVPILRSDLQTFRELIIKYFDYYSFKIGNDSKFRHFTDLVRCFYVETLPGVYLKTHSKHSEGVWNGFGYMHMHNATKLDTGGVKFEAAGNFSLDVRFENGCLKIPCLYVDDSVEMTFRNVMALEQCHYHEEAHLCNYVMFLDCLIDTNKDVDLLVEKGIIVNCIGQHHLVAEMVNNLNLGILEFGSYYTLLADAVNAYYSNPVNRSRAVLKSVYFGNLWTGTATVAAMLLLLMTLIQTVATIIQVKQ